MKYGYNIHLLIVIYTYLATFAPKITQFCR